MINFTPSCDDQFQLLDDQVTDISTLFSKYDRLYAANVSVMLKTSADNKQPEIGINKAAYPQKTLKLIRRKWKDYEWPHQVSKVY